MNAPSAAAVAAAKAYAAQETTENKDRLERVRDMLRAQRDDERELTDLTTRVAEVRERIRRREHDELPGVFGEVGINGLNLDAEGNLPAYKSALKPYYKAVVKSDWPPEKRDEAYDLLEGVGAGDLIKCVVTITYNREELKLAQKLVKQLASRKRPIPAKLQRDTNWNTLTAWLREQDKRAKHIGTSLPAFIRSEAAAHGYPTPADPLATLGAEVGHVVKLTEIKPD